MERFPPKFRSVIATKRQRAEPVQWQMYYKAKPYLTIDDKTAAGSLKGEDKKHYTALRAELDKFADIDPGDPPLGIGMHDVSADSPPTYRLNAGAWDAPREQVQPGFLSILDPGPAKIAPGRGTTGRRTALANWIAGPDNPLTARVFVNRLWFYHFGHGIVDSPSDFGLMGQRPTHPELLDWLASDFVQSGWDVKRMQKLIVTSNAYRESSEYNAEAAAEDPRDKLMWRFPRERLEAEVIRDAALAVSGTLNDTMGGPSVFPELPDGAVKPRGGWTVSSKPEDRNRRSIYIFVRRNARYPMLEQFDMPDTHESCGRRNMTITAPQAMALLNDRVSLEWASAFAGRVVRTAGTNVNAQINAAYRLAYGRVASGAEKDIVQTFIAKQKGIVAERVAAGEKIAEVPGAPENFDRIEAAVLVDFCQMLLNSNEFVYRN